MIRVFQYWAQGYENMPSMIKNIYEHNKKVCDKFKLDLTLITDENVKEFIDVPSRYWELAYNFRSDIVRYYVLNKYGGFWFDTDIILFKDLNLIVNKLDEKYDAILDVEIYDKIGCASLYFKKNTEVSNFCVNRVNYLLKNKKEFVWDDLGPDTIINLNENLGDKLLVNDYEKVKNGCNFICWNQKPGINKSGWFFNTPEEAKNKAISLINNENCYYLITWTIYRINDIKGDISEFVFNNNRSVFSYFVEYNKYEKGFVEIKIAVMKSGMENILKEI